MRAGEGSEGKARGDGSGQGRGWSGGADARIPGPGEWGRMSRCYRGRVGQSVEDATRSRTP